MSSVVLFSLVAVALVVAALAFVLPTLLRTRVRRETVARSEVSAQIYAQGIDELRQEVANNELAPADAQRAREELRRGLAEEAGRAPAADAPSRTRRAAVVVGIALPLVAVAIYLAVGKPGALSGEAATEAPVDEGGDYLTRLQSHLSRQPRDARGWVLLGRAQADRNDFKASADAYEKAITVSQKVAKDPGVLCEYADVLGMTQGGSLAGRPMELVERALAIDPKHPVALEMAGSAAYAEGRFADAVRYWKELLAGLTPGSERHSELSAAVLRAERKAAVSLPR
jgi:cytochrome c-type biogenesis protein CcmH